VAVHCSHQGLRGTWERAEEREDVAWLEARSKQELITVRLEEYLAARTVNNHVSPLPRKRAAEKDLKDLPSRLHNSNNRRLQTLAKKSSSWPVAEKLTGSDNDAIRVGDCYRY